MYYLRCTNCGHLNEVKTEYLTFCSNCNKKLENNFSDWHKRNSNKSFADYQAEVCISEESKMQLEASEVKPSKFNFGRSLVIAVLIVAGIAVVGGTWYAISNDLI